MYAHSFKKIPREKIQGYTSEENEKASNNQNQKWVEDEGVLSYKEGGSDSAGRK